jgi:1-pyrroline-5-carboxylate dehydrogenase
VEPTIIQAFRPDYVTLCEEIFGPVLTIYVYDENEFEKIIPVIDATSPYALTGAVFSKTKFTMESLILAQDER